LSKYSREMIAQIVAANDIVDVIGGCIELKPSGMNRYKGLSPFTNEKTPSFMVSRDRQMYHCFSSGQGGDVISFIMLYEGLSFNEALQKLAERAGIKLESSGVEDDKEAYMRRRVLELNTFAAKFYQRCLLEPTGGAAAREYLKTRQLKEATETRFGLGLAPDDWSHLYEAATKKQFRDSEIMASGLARRGDRSIYDFFRNRLIVPIRDVSGNVVAFGGRDLGNGPAKYINSPETSAYKKSRVLYGLYEAREAMRRQQQAILVEGYFDLMRCFDVGIENVVATCGTALTEQQAMLIKRYVPEVIVVYDGDAAGIRAAIKSIGILTGAGLTVRAMTPPDGKDPDDFIRDEGAEEFLARIAAASDFVTFYIEMSKDKVRTIEGRTEIANELFAILQTLDEPIRVDQYITLIAKGLDVHDWDCKRNFERFCKTRRRIGVVQSQETPQQTTQNAAHKDDVDFIATLLAYPEHRSMFLHESKAITAEETAFALAKRLCETEAHLTLHDLDDEQERVLFSAAVNTETPEPARAHQFVTERISTFKRQLLEQEMDQILKQFRQAEKDKDEKRLVELREKQKRVSMQLQDLGRKW
jgi:DNA primase